MYLIDEKGRYFNTKLTKDNSDLHLVFYEGSESFLTKNAVNNPLSGSEKTNRDGRSGAIDAVTNRFVIMHEQVEAGAYIDLSKYSDYGYVVESPAGSSIIHEIDGKFYINVGTITRQISGLDDVSYIKSYGSNLFPLRTSVIPYVLRDGNTKALDLRDEKILGKVRSYVFYHQKSTAAPELICKGHVEGTLTERIRGKVKVVMYGTSDRTVNLPFIDPVISRIEPNDKYRIIMKTNDKTMRDGKVMHALDVLPNTYIHDSGLLPLTKDGYRIQYYFSDANTSSENMKVAPLRTRFLLYKYVDGVRVYYGQSLVSEGFEKIKFDIYKDKSKAYRYAIKLHKMLLNDLCAFIDDWEEVGILQIYESSLDGFATGKFSQILEKRITSTTQHSRNQYTLSKLSVGTDGEPFVVSYELNNKKLIGNIADSHSNYEVRVSINGKPFYPKNGYKRIRAKKHSFEYELPESYIVPNAMNRVVTQYRGPFARMTEVVSNVMAGDVKPVGISLYDNDIRISSDSGATESFFDMGAVELGRESETKVVVLENKYDYRIEGFVLSVSTDGAAHVKGYVSIDNENFVKEGEQLIIDGLDPSAKVNIYMKLIASMINTDSATGTIKLDVKSI